MAGAAYHQSGSYPPWYTSTCEQGTSTRPDEKKHTAKTGKEEAEREGRREGETRDANETYKNMNRHENNGWNCCSTWRIIAVTLLAACSRGALASIDITPAPEPAPETDGQPEFLLQMMAAGATFKAGEGSFDGVLTLENVNNETIAFSDRPERIAGTVPTDEFVLGAFAPDDGPADDSFFDDPPNAAFSCAIGEGEVARAVFVLRSAYESSMGAL